MTSIYIPSIVSGCFGWLNRFQLARFEARRLRGEFSPLKGNSRRAALVPGVDSSRHLS